MQPFIPPLTTQDLPPVGGRIGDQPEDFFVEELPAYEPSGSGEHLFVFVEKREKNTRDVARMLADATGVSVKDVGYAGMKDRQAVTRQWFSLPPGAKPEGLEQFPREGCSVVTVSRHKNKLRTGHLIGNRFRVTLVDLPDGGWERAQPIFARLQAEGLHNYFGPQRFGREGRNLEQAFLWLRAQATAPEPAPETDGASPRQQRRNKKRHGGGRHGSQQGPDPKLLSSVIQSEVFNRYAVRRLARGRELLQGDVVRLMGTGSHFIVDDPEAELPRFQSGDLMLTGPMIGPKGLQATHAARELEEEIVRQLGLSAEQLVALGHAAPGTRRDLRLLPEELAIEQRAPHTLTVSFRLPAGSFATQVVREFTHTAWDSPREAIG